MSRTLQVSKICFVYLHLKILNNQGDFIFSSCYTRILNLKVLNLIILNLRVLNLRVLNLKVSNLIILNLKVLIFLE